MKTTKNLFATALIFTLAVTGFEAKARKNQTVVLNDRPLVQRVFR